MLSYAVLFAIMAVLSFSVGDVFQKSLAEKIDSYKAALFISGVGVLPLLAGYFLFPEPPVPLVTMAASAVTGIFFGLAYILLYRTFETEQVTVTIALAELPPALLVVLGIFAYGEGISEVGVLSIVLIFIGVALLITEEGMSINKRMTSAVLAFVIWAAYWGIMSYAISTSGNFIEPIAAVRIVSVVTLGAFVLMKGRKRVRGRAYVRRNAISSLPAFAIIAIGGIADGLGNMMQGATISINQIVIGSAIVALVPVGVGILGYVFYRDRLDSLQLLGFALMIVGAVALAMA